MNEPNEEQQPQPEQSEQPAKITQFTGIRDAVKDGLINAKEAVRNAIVQKMVAEKTDEYVRATTAVYDKIKAADKELAKIKPTYIGYDDQGKPKGEPFFSKEQVDQRKKGVETLAKLHKALELALNDNNFEKVIELSK